MRRLRKFMMKHCFAICAYGESPYLETCIKALKAQSVQTDIIVCTSTPNELIKTLAADYELPLYIRDGVSSLKDDWNFAAETAYVTRGAELVTIAHQDDLYHREYAAELLRAADEYPDMSLFCTRYRTIDKDGNELNTKAEQVKRILRLPLRARKLADRSLIKKLPLMFGNGIGCPTCSYNVRLTGFPIFINDYRFVIDWETLLRLSAKTGRFICCERELLDYRVHPGAETKKNIEDHNREREETAVYSMIWPRPVVRLLMHFYKKAYTDYDTNTN